MSVKIELSEKQANIVARALDLYSRLHAGQFEEILYLDIRHCDDQESRDANDARHFLNEAKRVLTGFNSNCYYGISSDRLPESAKIAYEVGRVIEHAISWDKCPQGGMTVNFDKPLIITDEPHPAVHVV